MINLNNLVYMLWNHFLSYRCSIVNNWEFRHHLLQHILLLELLHILWFRIPELVVRSITFSCSIYNVGSKLFLVCSISLFYSRSNVVFQLLVFCSIWF